MKRTPLAALALVAALGVGCDDEPEPDFAPPETTSPAPSDPTTTDSPEPEKLSPEETVRAWVEAQNLALRTGDTSEASVLSQACDACKDFIDPIKETYEAGGRYRTNGWRIVSLELQSSEGANAKVAAGIEFAGGRRIPEAGAQPVIFGPEKHIMLFELSRAATVWQINLMGFVP